MKVPTNFSLWMRNNLKDAFSGLITQDIDFIITREDKHFFIVEEKNNSQARTGPAQAIMYKLLNDILSYDDFFEGCHKLTMNSNGTCYVNQTSSKDFLNFINNPKENYINGYGQTWFEKIIYFNLKYLWDCKGQPRLQKTEKEHSFQRYSALEKVLENNKISTSSIDWIFLNYCTGNFALFFENEKEDHTIKRIIECFQQYNKQLKKAFNPKSNAVYKYMGTYRITYDDKFKEFVINGHRVAQNIAIEAFNLENDTLLRFQ